LHQQFPEIISKNILVLGNKVSIFAPALRERGMEKGEGISVKQEEKVL
jgi:hypothetical protein